MDEESKDGLSSNSGDDQTMATSEHAEGGSLADGGEITTVANSDTKKKLKLLKAASSIGISGSMLQPRADLPVTSESMASLENPDSAYSGKEYVYRVLRRWKRNWKEFTTFGVNKTDLKVWGQRVKKTRSSSDVAVRPTLQRMVKTHQFHDEMQLQLRDESVKLHYSDVFSSDCEPSPKMIRVFSFGASVFEYTKLFLGVWTFFLAWLVATFWKVLRPISSELLVFDLLLDLLYALCVAFQLRTTILKADRGMEVCSERAILRYNLMDRCFWLDVCSCCPLVLLCSIIGDTANAPSWAVLMKAFRGWRILRLPPKHRFVTSMTFTLVRIAFGYAMGGHLLACLWYYLVSEYEGTIGEHIQSTEKRWQECISFTDLRPDGCLWKLYSLSFNQGIYLLLGIDRDAYSAPEHFFLTICLPLGALVHARVLAEIILLLQRRGTLDSEQDAHTQKVQEAMRILGLPAGLQVRIITYFTYERLRRSGRLFDQFFTDLSPQLRFELQLHMYLDLVVQAGLFKNMRPRVIREIVLQLEDVIFLPGDWICRYGDYGDSMYFIMSGSCTIIAKDATTTLTELERGNYFGEVALLTGVSRTAYVLAHTFCIVANLTKDRFEPILRKWPEEIDSLLSGMASEQDRARIKEEAYKHYGLNLHCRLGSRRVSRASGFSTLRRRSYTERRHSVVSSDSSHGASSLFQRRSQGSFGPMNPTKSSWRRTSGTDMTLRRFEMRRSLSVDAVNNGQGSELFRNQPLQPSADLVQSIHFGIPGSVSEAGLAQAVQLESRASEDTPEPDETAQIAAITSQLSDIVAAVVALSKESQYQRETLALSFAELKQAVFETTHELIAHEAGIPFHGKASTPSDCGEDSGGLEAVVI